MKREIPLHEVALASLVEWLMGILKAENQELFDNVICNLLLDPEGCIPDRGHAGLPNEVDIQVRKILLAMDEQRLIETVEEIRAEFGSHNGSASDHMARKSREKRAMMLLTKQ